MQIRLVKMAGAYSKPFNISLFWYYIKQIMNVFIRAMVRIFSFCERWNVPFNSIVASLNGTFHLSPHENILTIALINIHYLYIVKLTFFGVFALYSQSMRRNQVKSGISRTSTHHRRMKNIRMLKETKSQVNILIFSSTGFDCQNIRADRTSEHSTILCRLRSNSDF
jgi:hypothetical protein